MPYTKTPEFPSHGVPDASEDITGGIGWGGMASLQDFLNRGGLLITLGNGSAIALDGGLARNVGRGTSVDTPGVELTVKFERPDHPLAYGYPRITSAFRTDLPTYAVRPQYQRFVVLQWGTKLPKRERDPDAEKAAAETDKDKPKESDASVRGVGRHQEGRRRPRRTARDSRRPVGEGPRARLQLQPDAPRSQPLGLSVPVERDPELERAAARPAVRPKKEEAMKNTRVLAALAGTALLWSLPARSQSINPGLPDPFRLTEPKNFEAFRSSSNNEDWNSNDDSKRRSRARRSSSRTSRGPASSRTSG